MDPTEGPSNRFDNDRRERIAVIAAAFDYREELFENVSITCGSPEAVAALR